MQQFLESIEWLALLQTLVALFAAYIALTALNTWKHQAKVQKQTDFLDQITDSVHEYMQLLSQPIELLKFIHMSFESHKGLQPQDDEDYSHITAYIKSRGTEDSKRMFQYLEVASAKVAKIQSLVARGQVYDFKNYRACQDSVKMLLGQHQRLQVVAAMIGSPSLNKQNPNVKKGLKNMLTVQPKDIEDHFQKYNLEFIEFVQENYRIAYAGT